MNSFDRFFHHLEGGVVDCTPSQPILMRYLARMIGVHYRDFCMQPEVKVRANIFAAEKFDLDGVDVMSDPYAESYDHGAELIWFEDKPPAVKKYIIEETGDLKTLTKVEPDSGQRMNNRLEEIQLYAEQVKSTIPIIGWVEGPLAQACIFRDMQTFMMELISQPGFATELMDWLTEMEIEFAREQVRAGADVIGVGDAAASLVSPEYFAREIAPRHRRIVEAIHEEGAVSRLHICGNIDGRGGTIAEIGYDIVDVDHITDLAGFRSEIGPDIILQGNVDPVNGVLRATPDEVHRRFVQAAALCGPRRMIGAGCEIPPDTPEENIRAMLRVRYL
jgi:MtaA/CmuA family methyltransferase